MKTIKTTFSYNEKTMTDFFTFHLMRKDRMRFIYYGISLLFLIGGIIISFVFKKYFFGLIVIVAAISMFILFPFQAKRAAKKTMQSRYKRAPQDIIFTEERIEQHLDNKIYVYKWDLVKEVDETKEYIYFYIAKSSAIIAIKQNMEENDYNSLMELIKDKNIKYYKYNV